MIKKCDLTLKLPQGKTKRISDIYGLSAFLRGGKYKTTVLFQQRVTVKGKFHFVTLKADTLKEARELAIKQYNDLHSVLYKGESKTTLYEALIAYKEHYAQHAKPSSIKRLNTAIGRHLEKAKHTEIHLATPEDIFHMYLEPYITEHKYVTLKYFQSILFRVYKLAKVKDPSIPDISSVSALYKIKPEESHYCSLTYKDIGKLPKIPIIELSLYLLLRPAEIVNIKLEDINFEEALLVVPETKTMKNFIQPLCTHAIKLMKQIIKNNKRGIYIFEGNSKGHLSYDYVRGYLRDHGFSGIQTAHAFRSMGRTWMEDNGIKYEVAEACLSHKVRDNTFRAYARTDYLNERRQAMQLWGDYVNQVLTGS